MLLFLLGLWTGGTVGVLVMCLFRVGGQAEDDRDGDQRKSL